MASTRSKKSKESALDLCTRATLLGNNISVRMLEFLSHVKHHPHGFRDLANDFLDICRILWSIEAGLEEAARTHQDFPAEMMHELEIKFRQTNEDFHHLDHMMFEFLEYEKRGTMGKLQRGWRMMFADKEIIKMRVSLQKARDTLRMSALMFQWSLGNSKTEDSVGSGYASLAEALNRIGNKRPTAPVRITKSKSFEQQALPEKVESDPPLPPLPTTAPHIPPPSPVVPLPISDFILPETARLTPDPSRRISMSNRSYKSASRSENGNFVSLPTTRIPDKRAGRDDITISEQDDFVSQSRILNKRFGRDDATLSPGASSRSAATMENEASLQDLHIVDTTPKAKVMRLKADPLTMPRWTPRHSTDSTAQSLRSALISAVHGGNHKLVEQLLDRGVSPDTGPETHILVDAVLSHDTESLRLLLLFGADANAPDKDDITPLFAAVDVSWLEGAKMLLKYGADPNLSSGPDLESPLAAAVIDNKIEFVQLLLTYGGDPNHIMTNGNTVLIIAMNKSMPKKLVDLMLEYGSDPNEKNREGKTALFEAIQASRVDLVSALLDHGANPNLPGPKHMLWPASYHSDCLKVLLAHGADSKKTPGVMELAVSINNIDSVRVLLEAGVSPNTKKDGIYTPLCTAIRDNRQDIFYLLLENGVDPNLMASEYPAFKCITHFRTHFLPPLVAAGSDLNTPKGIIETAVSVNNMEGLMWLLDQGVDPNDKSDEGHTPLTTAIRENRLDFVDELISRGADPNIRGQDLPVCMAVRHPEILKKLLPAVADPRAFQGLMEIAVVANELDSIKLLLKAGVSVEDRHCGVFSPLTTAIREDNKIITKFLLEEGGADPNAPGEHLPLVKAVRRCRGDDVEIIEMLLRKGADANKLYRGWNAIMQAVENGDARVLKLLVGAGGVDPEARDEAGRTVLEIAAGRGWEEAVSAIMQEGKAEA